MSNAGFLSTNSWADLAALLRNFPSHYGVGESCIIHARDDTLHGTDRDGPEP